MKKDDIYKLIRITGMISFIPIILAAGPLSGYVAGDYLEKRFSLSPYVILICIGLGSIASIIEVVKIIKRVLQINK